MGKGIHVVFMSATLHVDRDSFNLVAYAHYVFFV